MVLFGSFEIKQVINSEFQTPVPISSDSSPCDHRWCFRSSRSSLASSHETDPFKLEVKITDPAISFPKPLPPLSYNNSFIETLLSQKKKKWRQNFLLYQNTQWTKNRAQDPRVPWSESQGHTTIGQQAESNEVPLRNRRMSIERNVNFKDPEFFPTARPPRKRMKWYRIYTELRRIETKPSGKFGFFDISVPFVL